MDLKPAQIRFLEQQLHTETAVVERVNGDLLAGVKGRLYQKATGEPVAIFDFERTTKSWYLRAMGINEQDAFVKQPESASPGPILSQLQSHRSQEDRRIHRRACLYGETRTLTSLPNTVS